MFKTLEKHSGCYLEVVAENFKKRSYFKCTEFGFQKLYT